MSAQRHERVPEQLIESAAVTHVYRSIDDVYGQPIMTLRVDVPRQITLRGYSAVAYASGYSLVAAVVVLILLVVILNRVVLTPLGARHAPCGGHRGGRGSDAAPGFQE